MIKSREILNCSYILNYYKIIPRAILHSYYLINSNCANSIKQKLKLSVYEYSQNFSMLGFMTGV